jgi:hypothetical protein
MKVGINGIEYEESEYVIVEASCYDFLNKSEEPLEEIPVGEFKLTLQEGTNLKELKKMLNVLKKV